MNKEIKILYLYYDLLNLYGESGNVRILEKRLKDNGFSVTIDRKTIGDEIYFDDYSLVYMGSGTESKLKRCASHFMSLKGQIEAYVESGKVLLATGNAYELLGSSITDGNGEKISCAGIFDFETVQDFTVRKTGDVICSCDFIGEKIVGFINNCSTITGLCDPMFTFELGGCGARGDGVRKGNTFGTHITGPLLVKNPYLLEYVMEIICEMHGVQKSQVDEENYQYKGYRITLTELMRTR
ncbi:MAG: hypothetical protein IKU25_07800 [Clostridia bacterium]|nr:hypothetical protein [Clostridia bacterium]